MTTKKTTTKKPATKPKTEAEKAADVVAERLTLATRLLYDTQTTFNGADVIALAKMIKDEEW